MAQDRLTDFGTANDPDFFGALLGSLHGAVVCRTSAPTPDLVERYAAVLEGTGHTNLEFRLATVKPADQKKAEKIIRRADDALRALGIRVWSIRPVDLGQTLVVSYQDSEDRGLPQWLIDELGVLPAGTVEFRRVAGRHGQYC